YNSTGECDRNDSRQLIDADIVQACKETTGNKYQIFNLYDYKYYKNIFCSICQT
ncbi:hypothetical protein BgiBS90_016472, partial [Biomphalaria glabrata]